ncbi:MAG TPA: hypothetical protein DHU96_32895 [Actinobacteria bacterium]|nr:hypothetical protein [Actinomycetota bacterium]
MSTAAARFGRAQRLALGVAVAWSLGLLVAAVFAPAYQTESGAAPGQAAAFGSATLVQVNGWRVLVPIGVPLLCAVLVGVVLWRRAWRRGPGLAAWLVTALLAVFSLLAMLSVGVWVVPVTVALAVACGTHRSRAEPG